MIIIFVLWGGGGGGGGGETLFLALLKLLFFSSVMGLEKLFMFSREGRGAINAGSGVLGIMDGKFARKTLLDKGGKSRS